MGKPCLILYRLKNTYNLDGNWLICVLIETLVHLTERTLAYFLLEYIAIAHYYLLIN